MADVRAMLRTELASRKATDQSSKKRKAAPEETQPESKKAKNATVEPVTKISSAALPARDSSVADDEAKTGASLVSSDAEQDPPDVDSVDIAAAPAAEVDGVDEDEWAAFERDVATPPPDSNAGGQPGLAVLNAPATITAQPLSAAELAAQAREVESTQRGRRDVEREDEKEEAQLQLQEEFAEMEELEDRVRKLREKREAIRRASDSRPNAPGVGRLTAETSTSGLDVLQEKEQETESEEDDESDADDEQWDLWRT